MNVTLRSCAILLLAGVVSTSAGTIIVSKTADSGAGSLRQAIAGAASGSTITFAPNVTGTITLTTGHLSVTQSSLTIKGPGANVLAISGNKHSRIFFLTGSGTVTISGLTMENGLSSYDTDTNLDHFPGYGGAIYSDIAALTLVDCAVINSIAVSNGYHFGLGLGGGIVASRHLTLTRCTVSGNTIICADSNNSAINGGGDGFGGGVCMGFASGGNPPALGVTNCTIVNNVIKGGDNYTDGNHAGGGKGGGIYTIGGTLNVNSSTISGNTIIKGQQHAKGPANAAVGGGITTGAKGTTLNNTIVAKNVADPADGTDLNGAFTGDFNLIGDGTAETGLANGANGNQVGTTTSRIDPKLASLADNGGPTETMALLPGSPAIDKGNSFGLTTDQRGFSRPDDNSAIANASGGDGSDIGAFEVAVPAQLLNISTRMEVLRDENVLIGGFIVTGTDQKKVLLRAIGPSLGINGQLEDPVLELHDPGGNIIATNDNWKVNDKTGQSQQSEIEATQVPPSKELESALIATLPANNSRYTVIVRGKNNTTGIGLVEVYDLNQQAKSLLANISTRGYVDTGNNVMIGGLIAGPSNRGSTKILLRAIGPSLPVNGALADPTLELHDANGLVVATNDNWKIDDATGHSQQATIEATGAPPKNEAESALVQTIKPGKYTAIVRGKNNTPGIALVEAYDLR